MTLPTGNARRIFGRHVIRRLALAGYDDLKVTIVAVHDELITTKRAAEDAEEPLEDANVVRMVAAEALDDLARASKSKLEARSVDAAKEEPCTAIFANGLAEFVEVALTERVVKSQTLAALMEKHLPLDDLLRREVPSLILRQLEAWKAASVEVEKAQTSLDLARKEYALAGADWVEKMEATYGALVNRVGKKKAERFFPKTRRSRAKVPAPAEQPPPSPCSEEGKGRE